MVTVDYWILGPLLKAVRGDGVHVKLRPRERELVTILLVLAWSPVSRRTLVRALWGDNPPRNPEAALGTLFSRARSALGRSESRLTAVQGSYLADPPPQDLDVGRFLNLRTAADLLIRQGQLRAASIKLEQALGCWPEPALVNLPAAPEIDAQRTRLLEQRRAAMLAWADTLLELGDHDRILPILHARAVVDPLGERSWAQFIAALHQGGRREAALAAYSQARSELIRAFGTEPGAELQHLLHLVRTGTPPAPRYFAASGWPDARPGPLPGRGRTGARRGRPTLAPLGADGKIILRCHSHQAARAGLQVHHDVPALWRPGWRSRVDGGAKGTTGPSSWSSPRNERKRNRHRRNLPGGAATCRARTVTEACASGCPVRSWLQ